MMAVDVTVKVLSIVLVDSEFVCCIYLLFLSTIASRKMLETVYLQVVILIGLYRLFCNFKEKGRQLITANVLFF